MKKIGVLIAIMLALIIGYRQGQAVEFEYDGRVEYKFRFSEKEMREILTEHLVEKGYEIPPDGEEYISHIGTRTIFTIHRKILAPPAIKMPEYIRSERGAEP
ncbi:MAG TPA: hypothetical protein PKI80_03780 [Deltaproteobacteria bacterium]|nr:hypothetical protein [Deltaproteobacteria bacterium]HNS82726.1 hypothetical protein [Methanolinea sp.]